MCVSTDYSFLSVRQEPTLGPWKRFPFLQQMELNLQWLFWFTIRRPSEVIIFLSIVLCRSAHYWNAIKLQRVGGTLKTNHWLFREKKRRQSSLSQLELSLGPGQMLQSQGMHPTKAPHHFLFKLSFLWGIENANHLTKMQSCEAMQELKRES